MGRKYSRLFVFIALVAGAIVFGGTISYGAEESSITGITPTLGPVGTQITITGENFGVDDVCYEQGNGCHLLVYFNDDYIEYGDKGYSEAGAWTENKITALIPSDTKPGKVTIRVKRTDPDGENFDLTADQSFTVTSEEDSPAITKIYPQHAVAGDEIVITGQNLNDACENKATLECSAQINIGDTMIDFQVNATGYGVSWADTQIVVRIPEDTETGGTVRVYRSETFNWGEEDAYLETYNITGGEVEIHEKSSDATREQEIADIENEANAYSPDDPGFVTGFDTITEALKLGITRDTNAETEAEKLLDKIYGDFSTIIQADNQYSYIFFVAYNIGTGAQLGAGERAGVINSWRKAYDQIAFSNHTQWEDMLKIVNGRWPTTRNTAQEIEVSKIFEKIYKRTPNRDNANDDAAVMIMAYGLRPEPRNTQSEAKAIGFFKGIFGYEPQSALDWDVVRAIAYSGATR